MAELSTLGSVIKTAYEAEADTNAFTDAEQSKLAGIETGATAGIKNVVEDTTPQLGGNLDVNGKKIVSASGGNIDIEPDGTGNVLLGNFTIDADATIGAGQDNYVLTYDNAAGTWGPEAAAGGITWSTPVNADIVPDGDSTRDLGATATRFAETYTDTLYLTDGTATSAVADGASAQGFRLGTANTLSTAGADLLTLRNNATDVFDFSYQGGIDHVNSGASTAAHSQSLNLNWSASTTQTSSGQYSVVIGRNNTASGSTSFAGGDNSGVSGVESFSWGNFNNISGDYSGAIGDSITMSATASFAAGQAHIVSGHKSVAFGRYASVTNRQSLAVGGGSSLGIAQSGFATLFSATTDATQTTIQADSTNYVIPGDTTWAFSGLVVARSDEADGNVSAAWKFEGVLYRDESNNTVIQGVAVTNIYTGFSTAAVAVEADDTNEALAIKVTGEASTNIRWVAKVDIAQVTYA